MARVKLNPVLDAIHGKVGDLVFRTFNHGDFVGKIPDRTGVVPSTDQLAQMEKFRLAVLYGKSVMADAVTKQIYTDAAARKGQPVFALTVGDFLNEPAVDEVDVSAYSGKTGDAIRVRASDDVEVKGVAEVIKAQDGSVLEEGAATWSAATATWTYTATTNLAQGQSVSIEVTATDLAGHTGSRTQSKN